MDSWLLGLFIQWSIFTKGANRANQKKSKINRKGEAFVFQWDLKALLFHFLAVWCSWGLFSILRSLLMGRHLPFMSPLTWTPSFSHQFGPSHDQKRLSGSFVSGGLRRDANRPLDAHKRRALRWILCTVEQVLVLFVLGVTCALWLSVILQVGSSMAVSGGGLPDVYHTIQLHFHWGAPATNGSEHTVDRRRYPMEVQYGQ